MTPLKIRNVMLGEGRPKICVPVTGRTEAEIYGAARAVLAVPADLAEWRADWYENGKDPEAAGQILAELRRILGDMPLLFTFRTAAEGGEQAISPEEYLRLNQAVCSGGTADLIDIEYSMGESVVPALIQAARQAGVCTVLSSHDFRGTPPADEMLSRLQAMEKAGAHIPKLAVMPRSEQDVMALLEASFAMKQAAQVPFVAISMSQTGVISRLSGEFFGSAFTFGTAASASAPGQISAGELKEIMEWLHRGLQPCFSAAADCALQHEA